MLFRSEPSEDGPHYHLIDVETGKVVEFQDIEHERLMHIIAERLGFDVVSLRLELFGRRRGSSMPSRIASLHADEIPPDPHAASHDSTTHDTISRDTTSRDTIRGTSR